MQVIASFNLFAQPQLMTGGGPDRSTMSVMMCIYADAFNSIHPRVGSACAMGFMTGLIMLAFLLLQFRLFVRRTTDVKEDRCFLSSADPRAWRSCSP